MNAVGYGTRRKACDFCVSRKIKCDISSPNAQCSNCILYGATCKITAVTSDTARKKAALRYARLNAAAASASLVIDSIPSPSSSSSSVQPDRIDALEARLANIESYLAQLATRAQHDAHVKPPAIPGAPSDGDTHAPAFQEGPVQHASGITTPQLELPPLPELSPIVDRYFKSFNHFLPLFDESTFTRMLLDLYSSPSNRSVISWAAVNAVLAIVYRVLDGLPAEDSRVSACFRNVNSATTSLMSSQDDLLSIQTLLAMVIIFQGSLDPQLSIVLMGTAMRQLQMMKLHRKQSLEGHSPAAVLQRRRVFWIAYWLDRDLSLRSKCPYFQLDSETDHEMPEKEPEDGLGVISSAENDRFNFLRARVELAFIQGKAYDTLNSKNGQNLPQQQRMSQLTRIETLLGDWRAKIPNNFLQVDTMQRLLPASSIQLLTSLYFRHLECLCRIKAIFYFDFTWIRRIVCYLSPSVIELRDDEADGEIVRTNLAPLPATWSNCVDYCRGCLDIAYLGIQTDYAYWLHGCGTLTCIIVLIVNMIEFPADERIPADRKVIDIWYQKSLDMGVERSSELVEMLNIFHQLDRRARGQINRSALSNAMNFPDLVNDDFLDAFQWETPTDVGS